MLNQIFKDLVVVELASVLAGPAVGMFFAELGAKVIKIENKTTKGDVTRNWKLSNEKAESPYSAYFCAINWHKEYLFLDLSDEKDKNEALKYIETADIVISNFKKSSAQKMGLDYDALKKIKPTLIYAQLNAFDEEDETPAFDVVLQAEAGFLYMTGEPNRPPVKMPVALIDILAAHQLKEAILIALLERYKTGKGSYVYASLYDSALASLANQATNYLMAGHIPQPMGTQHPNIAPYGDIFKTKDKKLLVLAIGTERQFKMLCETLYLPQLIEDERFSTNFQRVKNRAELVKILQKNIKKHQLEPLLKALNANQVPAGAVRNMQEVFDQDRAKKLILHETLDDGTESKRVKTVAFEIKSV